MTASGVIRFSRSIPSIPPRGARNGKTPEPLAVRFWRSVKIGKAKECWPWMGAGIKYGGIKVDGKMKRCHRVAFELAGGVIPENMLVRHSCDNPPCCNPSHLLTGTDKDNRGDAVSRNRLNSLFGEDHQNSKLTLFQVSEIRRRRLAGVSLRVLSSELGVSESTVSRAANGRNWKDAKA